MHSAAIDLGCTLVCLTKCHPFTPIPGHPHNPDTVRGLTVFEKVIPLEQEQSLGTDLVREAEAEV